MKKRAYATYRVTGFGRVLDVVKRTASAAIKEFRRSLGDKRQPNIDPATAIEKGISIECRGKLRNVSRRCGRALRIDEPHVA
jgi:hypothetical protein